MTNFISLHNHTDFSILDSLSTTKDLFLKAKELEQSALAITDHGSIAAAWDALKISKSTGVKLIIGCECYFKNDLNNNDEKLKHIILLAKNAIGYRNLLTLNKRGFDQNSLIGKRVYSIIDWKLLEEYSEGLICLTACGNGIINQLLINKKFDEAEKAVLRLKDIFKDNFALEIQPHNMKRGSTFYNDEIDQKFFNHKLIELGKKHNIKVVPTCNTHYINKEDHVTHDVLLAIGSHQPIYSNFRLKYTVPDFYLKSGDDVKSFFSRNYGDDFANEICENTMYFAKMCENPKWIDPKFSNPSGKELPSFPVKNELDYNEFKNWLEDKPDYIKSLSEDKAYLRYKVDFLFKDRIIKDNIQEQKIQEYKDRIEKEFDTLETLDLCSYMLITADFLNFARQNNISIGPGRGSAGGSYIAYLLNIHKADSIKYDLVFERFHNKLKLATSDIDNDIAASNRDQVITYVRNKYGDEHVAYVSNVNRNTPKIYIKDIARACELGGSREEGIRIGAMVADCIAADIHSIDEALAKAPLFCEYCKRYPEFIKHKSICNLPRAVSTHAAGIIVASRPLVGLVPVRRDKEGSLSIEYDKEKAEDNGLVKIDFLGLKTLDVIDITYNLIKSTGKPVPEINFEEYDEKTYNLISSGNTLCVFQFGTSTGTIDLCKKIKPKNIEDLAVITTLARPASAEIRNDFILTRQGEKEISLLHPKLQNAFKNTFGFPLYDESLLILAKDIAGWDLGEADKLRKLTKEKGKNPAKAKKWKEEFIQGAVNNNIDLKDAEDIWTKVVEPYGKYSFNKSLYEHQSINVYDKNGDFLQAKPIKDINFGDYLKSRDEDTKKDIFIKVKDKHDHGKLPLVEVELESGEKIKCTMNHKFRVKENGQMLPLWKIIKDGLSIVVGTADLK